MKKKKNVFKILLLALLPVLILCVCILIGMYIPHKDDMSQFLNNPESETAVSVAQTITAAEELPENPVNFSKLIDTNKDVYAWIRVPGTGIDYAVAQSSPKEDDLFYLSHDINKKYLFDGMIFSEKKNAKDFSDPVTVLYGHNLKNGAMFTKLHKFEDKKFFNSHDKFYIYTPGHILTYSIVSAYNYDNRHILNTFDFSKKSDLKKYIKSINDPDSNKRNVRKNISASKNDRIVTLSTCNSVSTQRYLVQGILTDDTLTKQP